MRLLDSPFRTGAKPTGAEGAEVILLWSTLLCGEDEEGTTTKQTNKKTSYYKQIWHQTTLIQFAWM